MNKEQEDKKDIIIAIENYYFKGIYDGDLTLLENIYHPETLLFGDVQGQQYSKTLEQYLDAVKNRQSPRDSGKPFKGEIISVKVVNTIAVAEVTVKMYDFNYHDILSLHKLHGKWLIVNKLMSDVNHKI